MKQVILYSMFFLKNHLIREAIMCSILRKIKKRYQCNHEFGVYNYTHIRCKKCGKKKKDEIRASDFIAREWSKSDKIDSK